MHSREDEDDLAGLSWNWDGAYTFALSDNGIWTATAVGEPTAVLAAHTADELREKVRAEYTGRQPVPGRPATPVNGMPERHADGTVRVSGTVESWR